MFFGPAVPVACVWRAAEFGCSHAQNVATPPESRGTSQQAKPVRQPLLIVSALLPCQRCALKCAVRASLRRLSLPLFLSLQRTRLDV